ncbi:hypothetical protein GN244_ATG04336 [Phytophthora infestans]|uniref:Uncharacterized protein n=1 Tax=Phytophthora infestans TaxID=4787 RepID=A0A833WZA2_PHYIN|nr:hypothetical protein GN244_ATG04336 [Phytophthora infestans]KAF4145989.1 hypothetical protein GN958_ATG04812 [Phytophthora infestans]
MRQCRSVLPPTEEEMAAAEQDKTTRRVQVPSLVDLCLRFVTKHFESVCMDRIVTFPEAEAALIGSMPSNLVHRMVVNLVKDSKRVKAKHRAMVETFESALQRARLEIEQLECPAATASRWIEQQQHFEQRKCEVHREGISLSSVESENRRLTTAAKNAEKNKCRLEAKIDALKAENISINKASKQAQNREMELKKKLVKAGKVTRVPNGHYTRTRVQLRRSGDDARRLDIGGSSSRENPENTRTGKALLKQRQSRTYRKRPRAEGSNIPYPKSMRIQTKQ